MKPSTDAVTINYAQTCVDAMQIHEDSFNHEAAKLETEAMRRQRESAQSFYYMYQVDYSQFYEKDMMQSCIEACKQNNLSEELAYPILLSFSWSNDLLDWADMVLGD